MDSDLDKQDLEKLSEILTIRDEQGRPMLKVGWVVRMYFAEPWTLRVREAVSAVAEGYIQAFREHLRWAQHPRTGRMHPIETGRVAFPWEWLPKHDDERASWNLGYHGGAHDEDASSFSISALGSEKETNGVGYLEAYLPLSWFADHPGSFQGFVLDLAKRLRPLSGYGAVGTQPPLDADGMKRSMYLVRQLAERLPGLDVGDAISESLCLEESDETGGCLKGASWLTVLCDAYVEKLGGRDYLEARLGGEFPLTSYDGGLMLQAGPKPEIGDNQAKRWPRHLVTLSKVLAPLRFKNPYPIHGYIYKDHATMDLEATKAWLARFDDK
jgi:hypothetical protein